MIEMDVGSEMERSFNLPCDFIEAVCRKGEELQAVLDEEAKIGNSIDCKKSSRIFIFATMNCRERFFVGFPRLVRIFGGDESKIRQYCELPKEMADLEEELRKTKIRRETLVGQIRGFMNLRLAEFDPEFRKKREPLDYLETIEACTAVFKKAVADYIWRIGEAKKTFAGERLNEYCRREAVKVIAAVKPLNVAIDAYNAKVEHVKLNRNTMFIGFQISERDLADPIVGNISAVNLMLLAGELNELLAKKGKLYDGILAEYRREVAEFCAKNAKAGVCG